MSTKIYIGNLSFSTTEETLQNKFESFGTIESVSIIRDKNTQMSKGFGFVDFANVIEYHEALNSKSKKILHNKILAIK
jgi:RNA recognition motif-containing protein